jgi:hypothetical protein
MLTDAGVPFAVQVADVDEDALKTPGVDPVELLGVIPTPALGERAGRNCAHAQVQQISVGVLLRIGRSHSDC